MATFARFLASFFFVSSLLSLFGGTRLLETVYKCAGIKMTLLGTLQHAHERQQQAPTLPRGTDENMRWMKTSEPTIQQGLGSERHRISLRLTTMNEKPALRKTSARFITDCGFRCVQGQLATQREDQTRQSCRGEPHDWFDFTPVSGGIGDLGFSRRFFP